MKEYLCEVVPVYVRPQPLTDEKACVGVVLRCPEADLAAWRLADCDSQSLDRIANFFPRLGRENLLRALEWAKHDIEYSVAGTSREIADSRFANLIRPRENVIQYGSPRICVSKEPQNEVDRIYRDVVA